jgi:hypothetical protein
MNRDASDEELNNARQETESQIKDLEPWARQITEGRSIDDAFIKRLMNNSEIDQWDIQFKGILLKTIQAQAKYIELLERKIGKYYQPSFRLRYQINKNGVPSYADLVFYVRHLLFVRIFHISI